jgi:DNA polymerase
VDDYRSTHDRVVALWKATEGAVIEAVRTPGRYIRFGAARNLRFVVVGGYLCLQLPSGRWLFYAEPHVVDVETPWGTTKPQVQVMAVSGYSKRWEPTKLYGGLLVENIVQATSRDLLAEAMFRAEAAGYPVVMHVHDELVAEVPEGFGSVEEFEQLVAALPEWAEGCPIAAEGWRGKRYRK